MSKGRAFATPHVFKSTIHWGEMDAYQHLNNVHMLRHIESARVQLLEATGWLAGGQQGKLGPIVSHVSCDYLRPVVFPASLELTTWIDPARATPRRITMLHLVESQGSRVAVGKSIAVSFDYASQKPADAPPEVMQFVTTLDALVDPDVKSFLRDFKTRE